MPFGKHKGTALADLPDGYLGWLRTLDLREPLRSAVSAEWARRSESLALLPLASELRPVAEAIVTAGFRHLAQRHHPDRGGDTAAMQRLNASVAWLRAAVEAA